MIKFDGLRIIGSTNTQTRRLAYLVHACGLLAGDHVPQKLFQEQLEAWAENHNFALQDYVSDKGILQRSTRSYGARRYIKLAADLELITEVAGYLRPTVTGQVLAKVQMLGKQGNPFSLDEASMILMVYQLLLMDSDYLLPVLRLTQFHHQQAALLAETQETLLSRFEIMLSHTELPAARRGVYKRIETIRQWKKPVVYLEHIVLPRLHWLLDLHLLDWEKFMVFGEFKPSVIGSRLLELMPSYNDFTFVNQEWCRNRLFPVLAQNLKPVSTPWTNLSDEEHTELIEEYVHQGLEQFRTQTRSRISAYQLVLFMIIRLLTERRISANFQDIIDALQGHENVNGLKWHFFWSSRDKDGYLIFRKQ